MLVKLQYGKDLRRWTVRGEVKEAKPAPKPAPTPAFGAAPQFASPAAFGAATGGSIFGAPSAPAAAAPSPPEMIESEPRLTIAAIERKVREVFDLSREPLKLVYVDNEGETVTLEVRPAPSYIPYRTPTGPERRKGGP